MAGGRPTKYNEETTCEMALAYIAEFELPYDERTTFALRIAETPSLVGLSLYLGIANSTLDAWKADASKVKFSGICSTIMQLQHEILVGCGLSGRFNAQITKMMLSKHGYSDAVTQEVTSGGEKLQAPIYNIVSK